MAKGKKKDKKQAAEQPADTASEQQPSTSHVTPPVTEQEGLTGGSKEKSKDPREKGDGTPSAPAFAPAKEPPPPKEEVKEKDEEEEDGLGLGLGGAKKKRRPKKKKEATPEASVAAAAPLAQAPFPQTPLPPVSVHAMPQPTPAQLPHTPAHIFPTAAQSASGPHKPPASWDRGPTSTPQRYDPAGFPPGLVPAASRPIRPQAFPTAVESVPYPQQPPTYWGRGPESRPPRSEVASTSDLGSRRKDTKPPQGQIRPQQPFPAMSPIAASLPPTVQPSQPQFSKVTPGTKTADVSKICRYQIPTKIPSTTKTVSYLTVELFCNYFKMDIQPFKLHRYDVSFKPDRPKKLIPKAFEAVKNKFYRNYYMAYDQVKNCFTKVALPKCGEGQRFVENIEIVDDQGKTLKFEITIIHTGIVNLGTLNDYMRGGGTSLNPPTEAIQAIDVILRQGTLQSYIKAGRQFFKRPARPIDLGDGLEMWTGLFQSAIFTSRPFINIDVAHKGFPKSKKLTALLVEDFRLTLDRPIDSQRGRGSENFLDFIRGLRIVAPIFGDNPAQSQKRDFIVNEMRDIPSKMRFDYTDPKTGQKTNMSVADYFQNIKRVRLQYPNLNCLWVGPRDKNICYPIELLDVAYGQARNKQLNERQLSTMVRTAAAPPDERKCKIQEITRDMNYAQNPFFKEFGLTIDTQFYKVSGKILQPPVLDCGEGRPITPRQGAWNSRRLLKAMPLPNWGFVGLEMDPRSCNYDNIVALLKDVGGQLGIQVGDSKLSQFNVRPHMLAGVFREALSKGITFIFLVISGRLRDGYHRIKQAAECEVGIVTQCMKDQTAERRMNQMTMRNILLKVNSKLMGINQALATQSIPRCIKTGSVMIVGADVTHPSPDQKTLPSIAAVTASIDPRCFMYNLEMSVQAPKVEIIDKFEEIMVEHLKVFRQEQKRLPDKIYFYRDGVSEGQFAQVLNSELTAIYNAHQRLTGTNFKPEVLFLLVQKRHHTRLFVQDRKTNKAFNVEPGTLVDVDIVHPNEVDFYLVSHQAIKGTARPTRYHMVRNDGSIPYEEIEQLTYYLCHLFSRCPRSVSYPTPTYYAHLACLRARSLTYGMTFNNNDLEVQPKPIRVKPNLLALSRMFFV